MNNRNKIIDGKFYTPKQISKLSFNWLKDKITSSDILLELGAGEGNFVESFLDLKNNFILTDIDYSSVKIMRNKFKQFNNIKVLLENSVVNLKENKYTDKQIIVIGNPPFNDRTSHFKKGKKGNEFIDERIFNNDIGLSFFRLYAFLNAKYVCVVHPLSYLIKKKNFNSLKEFRKNYIIEKSLIFPSYLFADLSKNKTEFPMCLSLFKKNELGMSENFIKNFEFDIYASSEKFCLNKFNTIDGKIKKYPSKIKTSIIQFYTMRDINALMRSADFLLKPSNNSIDVSIEELWKYSWVFYFKNNFNNNFLSGNLSILFPNENEITNEFKKECVFYAFENSKKLKNIIDLKELEKYYGIKNTEFKILEKIIKKMNNFFKI